MSQFKETTKGMIKIIDEKMIDCIDILACGELQRAMEQYGKFNSVHEAYAVILEELEELKDEVDIVTLNLEHLWNKIKDNSIKDLIYPSNNIQYHAIQIAAEAIQVAAMGKKLIEFLEEK